jgi:hypothetical protein
MPTEKKILIYQFDELSEKAKEKARDWFRNGALDYEWWESVYEDAERIGLKITSFELDRRQSITGDFTGGAEHCAKAILKEHGDTCDSFKLAQAFLQERQALDAKLEEARDEDERLTWEIDEQITELEEEFKKDILGVYLDTLQKLELEEADYLTSDEAVDEAIRANEYTFLANGKRE